MFIHPACLSLVYKGQRRMETHHRCLLSFPSVRITYNRIKFIYQYSIFSLSRVIHTFYVFFFHNLWQNTVERRERKKKEKINKWNKKRKKANWLIRQSKYLRKNIWKMKQSRKLEERKIKCARRVSSNHSSAMIS